ncbi:ap-5 complex subunit beta-1 [Phtheirospermum japonicum]|uniref:Ap-5 complex subunit beta-1 n=1 Tax=Phtheirospermum japonicum TaxID=374723 RepID=A0A830BGK6_9LAMI|nr:ap-5 complex subunit beta-1 [Phtheirospermum japonicum]
MEWESLFDDYNLRGPACLHRWTNGGPVLDLCISSLLRKDSPVQLKLNLLTFLEHHVSISPPPSSSLSRLIDALRSVIQSPNDPFSLKDQFLVSTTSILITSLLDNNDDDSITSSPLPDLVELLLTIINRPNHSLDRHSRGVSCECLRQLELAFPCLLSEITPHLWSLCQSERTHVSQWYVLLLSTSILNVVKLKPSETGVASISNTTIPLIPFNVPQFLIGGVGAGFVWKEKEIHYKELRRVVAFLLECPQYLTPFGLVEFLVAMLPVAEELELQASLLRVQFSWLLRTFEPLLCHVFLGVYSKFLSSFQGQEFEVASRVLLLSKEPQHHLVFRLLGLHWMLGFFGLIVGEDEAGRRNILDMTLSFYPTIFDPLAIKALKLDLLTYCSSLVGKPGDADGVKGVDGNKEVYEVKLFEDGLVSVSSFKWLPPWSTETAVAFRSFHKFLIGGSPHNADSSSSSAATLVESNIFYTLQYLAVSQEFMVLANKPRNLDCTKMLVDSTSEFKGLVPVIIACIDRLLECDKHHWLGEHLLKTLDKHLLPKLKKDYSLGYYFPIFERISENDNVSPSGLLNLLMRFMIFLVETYGPDTVLKSWRHGSRILGICRTMLIHRHSSSLFTGLSHLLACTSLYFPDLEIRDNARFYLRMLICVPGKKLKDILNMGEISPGISPSTHSGAFFSFQSPQALSDLKLSSSIATYIHIERVIPLLVKQSWSLSLPNFGINPDKPGFFEGIRDNESAGEIINPDVTTSDDIISETGIPHQQKEPLRVMDAKVSEIVRELRRHFAFIPDYRHMPGIKIKISCSLRFNSEAFNGITENNNNNVSDGVDKLPALYATVLKFTSSAPYGPISSFHIPFILGSPPKKVSQSDSLAIVPVENGHVEEENSEAPVCIIELEPREPMPGLVDVYVETNADNGQVLRGQLHSISVGIEDMFLKANLPDDISEDGGPSYYMDLFNALWEACETSSSTGRETFVLKGGKGVAAISGTRSVKLVEVPATSLVKAVERHLARFVVSVIGQPLGDMVRDGGVINDVLCKDFGSDSSFDVTCSPTSSTGPLYLNYLGDEEDDGGVQILTSRKNIGYFQILIFLPPRFHLLFQMEIRDFSTLVRIRTDHWPCLAYVDDYLEALFLD